MKIEDFLKNISFLINKNEDILKAFCDSKISNKTIIEKCKIGLYPSIQGLEDNLNYYDTEEIEDIRELQAFYSNILTSFYNVIFWKFLEKLEKHNIKEYIKDWDIEIIFLSDWKITVDIRVISNNKDKLIEILNKYNAENKYFDRIFKMKYVINDIRIVKDFL